jgi:hypothetical protein
VTDPDRPEELRTKVYGERTVYDNPWVRLVLMDTEPPDGQRFSTTSYDYRSISASSLTTRIEVNAVAPPVRY